MKTAVVGAGAWGTALAILLCKNGNDTTLWFRDPAKGAADFLRPALCQRL